MKLRKVTKPMASRTVSVPSFPSMTPSEQQRVENDIFGGEPIKMPDLTKRPTTVPTLKELFAQYYNEAAHMDSAQK